MLSESQRKEHRVAVGGGEEYKCYKVHGTLNSSKHYNKRVRRGFAQKCGQPLAQTKEQQRGRGAQIGGTTIYRNCILSLITSSKEYVLDGEWLGWLGG